MNDKKKLLSICIPTFNRASVLRECLGRLCPIVSAYDDIEIFVSDNCSSDETMTVLREFESAFRFVRHQRQKENVGPDKNFESVLQAGRGAYRWLFGDSYFIQEESFQKLYSMLRSTDYDMCVINAPNRVTALPQKVYTDSSVLLEELGWHMTLLSALIYNERIIQNAAFARYRDSNFIQTGIIFEYFAFHNGTTLFLPDVFVNGFIALAKKDGGWLNRAYHIFCKKWYLFVMSLPLCYGYESKTVCIKAHDTYSKLFSLQHVLDLKYKGYSDFSLIREYRFFIEQTVNLSYRTVLLVNLLPMGLTKAAAFVCWKILCVFRRLKNKVRKTR